MGKLAEHRNGSQPTLVSNHYGDPAECKFKDANNLLCHLGNVLAAKKRPSVRPAGIGIDDMFVIVQCLKNIESGLADPSSMDHKKKIGLTLQKVLYCHFPISCPVTPVST